MSTNSEHIRYCNCMAVDDGTGIIEESIVNSIQRSIVRPHLSFQQELFAKISHLKEVSKRDADNARQRSTDIAGRVYMTNWCMEMSGKLL